VPLLPGSPAINGGNPAGCIDPSDVELLVDQRGFVRPQAASCDIGAFEFRVPLLNGKPRISGKPQVGQRLSCLLPAVQSTDGPATKDIGWLQNGRVVFSGRTYAVKPTDAGHALRCHLRAANAAGSASATSPAVSVPPLPTVAITSSDVISAQHTAKFGFVTKHATGAQCALARGSAAPNFLACTSPKPYTGLAKASYTFSVRAVGPGGTSAPAHHSFSIS
jgi:hypothetical protein